LELRPVEVSPVYLLALTPAAWLLAAALCTRLVADRWSARRRSFGAALLALGFMLVATAGLLAQGEETLSLSALPQLGAWVRLDPLSVTIGTLVSFVGVVVLRYSHAYLDGDARQGVFLRDVCLTVAAVSVLAIAGNAPLLWLAWVAMSLALHRLLLFRPERRGARNAARKKFFLARLGDASLGLALLGLVVAAGSADIRAINAVAATLSFPQLLGPALLLVFAAILKTAQFPTHGWLTEVMEAPTPVSALLHAGVVNAGGFLLIRFADVISASPLALYLLILVGGCTALYGSLVMLTQRSIKAALAYSTVAQMGFMLLQCGLGAFSSALLHIVAHSLYKAHAFLSSGSVVDLARGSGAQGTAAPLRPGLVLAASLVALAVFGAWSLLFGITLNSKPAIVGLGAVLLFGMLHLVMQSARERAGAVVLLRVSGTAAVVAGLYFTLQALALLAYESLLPAANHLDAVQWALMALVIVSFGAVTALQWTLPVLQRSRRGQALWVHLSNGLYVNQVFDQVIGAHRLGTDAGKS
jgi:NAD(P)H-quinone oxidoreductase subunit 5